MKALTLRHPWAFAVARLGKRIENRTWRPPASLVGQFVAIHGGASPRIRARMREAMEDARRILYTIPGAQDLAIAALGPDVKLAQMVTPGIVCIARVLGVETECDDPWFHGPFGWVLDDVFALPDPVPCRGAQGLWDVPASALDAIRGYWHEHRKAVKA